MYWLTYFWLCWVFIAMQAFLELWRVVGAALPGNARTRGLSASVVAAHGLSSCGSWALEHRLNSYGPKVYLLPGTWELSRSGIKPMFLLWQADSTSEPPEKPRVCVCSPLSHGWLFATPWTVAHQAPLSMSILQARILEWVAMPSSKGIFPTQESNSGLPHCRWILYGLSHQGCP